jgi:pimeloyl-ACP methyl ester carboxylesterase
VVLVVILGCVALLSAPAAPADGSTNPILATPVVFVHGASLGSCPGYNVARAWYPTYHVLQEAGWTGPADLVGYYRCDSGYTYSIGPVDDSMPIQFIARTLSWYLWFKYGMYGTTFDIVAHSMGGLLVRWMLYRIAEHDPQFAPAMHIRDVVTISTPHAGVGSVAAWQQACGASAYQCQQFGTDSTFIKALLDHPEAGGADWTTIGSDVCDIVPSSSATAMPGSHRVIYSSPCYQHNQYLIDMSLERDAVTQFGTGRPHALVRVREALLSLTA